MKIHVRRSKTYPMNYSALCSHNTKNKNGFVPLECVDPKTFISISKEDRCKHCEISLNQRRLKKNLPAIIFD